MKDTLWDVAVIGGGAAGMMAAGRAAELGAKVILIEKNPSLGKKLLITGGGRCNVTNAEPDQRKLLAKFKEAGKFLFSPFAIFDNKKAIAFFNNRGMETKVEKEERVFPASNSSESVKQVLETYLKEGKVTILSHSPVTELIKEGEVLVGVRLSNKETVRAKSFVLATGGTSRPETGSTGDGYPWLRSLGHKVIEPEPSLVPITLKDAWVKRLAGVSLSDAKLTTFQNNMKQESRRGKILFTHVGASGPGILNMSKDIGELLKYGEAFLSVDLFPDSGYDVLNAKLQELFKVNDKKKLKNALTEIVPSALAPVVIELSKVDGEKACNSVTREERLALVKLLKDIRAEISGLLGVEKAIIASGGVERTEVDWRTMSSKLVSNLYFAGDVLDIDRPTGGYSLQLCWTTGFIAGSHASMAK